MKLYANRAATTSRAVLAFCSAENIDVDVVSIDIASGEHYGPVFTELNPNRMIPVLEDDGFVLTESSAILRYLAAKSQSALYPEDLRERAKVDELIAWFEANFYKDFGFQYVYPQLFDHHSRGSTAANDATVEFGRASARSRLKVLDEHYLGVDRNFLVGDHLTIADFHGASILSLGELVDCSLTAFPNVDRWYRHITQLSAWRANNEAFTAFAESMRDGQSFVGLS